MKSPEQIRKMLEEEEAKRDNSFSKMKQTGADPLAYHYAREDYYQSLTRIQLLKEILEQ